MTRNGAPKIAGEYIFIGGGYASDHTYWISRRADGAQIGEVRLYQKRFTNYLTAEFGHRDSSGWHCDGEPFKTGATGIQRALEAVALLLGTTAVSK